MTWLSEPDNRAGILNKTYVVLWRFGLAISALALAGLFAARGRRPVTLGTLPTDGIEFGVLLGATALIVSSLSFSRLLHSARIWSIY